MPSKIPALLKAGGALLRGWKVLLAVLALFFVSFASAPAETLDATETSLKRVGLRELHASTYVLEDSIDADLPELGPEELSHRTWISLENGRGRIANRTSTRGFPVWFKIDLRQLNLSEGVDWTLVLHDRVLDQVEIFVPRGAGFKAFLSSYAEPAGPNNLRRLQVPVIGADGRAVDVVYMRIRSLSPIPLDAELLSAAVADDTTRREGILIGAFLGMMAILLVTNLLIFARDPNRARAWYLVYVFASMCFNAILSGLVRDALSSIPYSWLLGGVNLSGCFMLIGQSLFLGEVLELRKNFPRLQRFQSGILCVVLLTALCSFTPFAAQADVLAPISGLAAVLLCLVVSLASLKKSQYAKYAVVAFVTFWMSAASYSLANMGAIPMAPAIRLATLGATAFEVVCFSLILGKHIDLLHAKVRSQYASLVSLNEALHSEVLMRRKVEEELRVGQESMIHSARMRSLGEMAAGIAHEVNNPIASVRLLSETLGSFRNSKLERHELDAQVANIAQRIDQNCLRVANIINTMRRLCNDDPDGTPLDNVSLRRLCEGVAEMARLRLHRGGIRMIAAETDAWVLGRESEFAQILINLVNNAIDAVTGSESPWIRLDVQETDDAFEVSVTDSGTGIPASHVHRIMEPFFTSKRSSHGVGLGLTISQKLAQRHGGRLFVDTASPNTRFVLRLRKAKPQAVPASAA